MTTIPHEAPHTAGREVGRWFELPAVWESLAITAMWVAVTFASIFGPDFTSSNGGGSGNATTIPCGVIVAFFAMLGSYLVAKHGLGGRGRSRN
jgi:hypothetical protein